MGHEQTTRKKGRELQVGDCLIWEGQSRVIADIRPGFTPVMLDVRFTDGSEDVLPAVGPVFDVIATGRPTTRSRMRMMAKHNRGPRRAP